MFTCYRWSFLHYLRQQQLLKQPPHPQLLHQQPQQPHQPPLQPQKQQPQPLLQHPQPQPRIVVVVLAHNHNFFWHKKNIFESEYRTVHPADQCQKNKINPVMCMLL